ELQVPVEPVVIVLPSRQVSGNQPVSAFHRLDPGIGVDALHLVSTGVVRDAFSWDVDDLTVFSTTTDLVVDGAVHRDPTGPPLHPVGLFPPGRRWQLLVDVVLDALDVTSKALEQLPESLGLRPVVGHLEGRTVTT